MSQTEPAQKPEHPDQPTSPAAQVKVEQQVGAVTGGKVVGVEVHHAETVIIEAGQAAAPPEPGDPPYKGLEFYDVADAPLFFGREKLTAELVAFMRDHAFLAIVGASGSGKSSVARAGLVAALQGQNTRPLENAVQPPLGSRDWRYVSVTPTAHPFEALARALAGEGAEGKALLADLRADPLALRERAVDLAGAGGRLLLLVDQFEELFTLCKDEAERTAYVNALLAVSGEPAFGNANTLCTIILTLRADFYAPCLRHEKLRAALETQQKPIGAMTLAELQRTIELPAQAGNWAFQQGLVEQILRDVGDEPGKLPLLSYALLETWKRRSGRVMTLAGYQAAGGVDEAIGKTADRVFDDLSRQGLGDVARRVFLSLVDPGEDGRATRRRERLLDQGLEESDSPEARTLQALSAPDARLVTLDGESVQISHEALITAWPRLGDWLKTYRDDLWMLHGIRDAAAAWGDAPAAEKDDLLTHRGGRLDDAVTLMEAKQLPLTEREQAYVRACVELRRQETEAERQRQEERVRAAEELAEAQSKRAQIEQQAADQARRWAAKLRLRALIAAAVGVMAVIAAAVAIWLGWQAHISEQRVSQALIRAVQLQYSRAIADIDARDYESAQIKLADARRTAEDLDPLNPVALTWRGYIAKAFAQIAAAKGDQTGRNAYLAEAERLFTDITRLAPTDAGAYNGLGNVQSLRGNFDAAIESYLKAIRILPQYGAAYHDLALAYEAKRRADPEHDRTWCTKALDAWRKTDEIAGKSRNEWTGDEINGIRQSIQRLAEQCK